MDPFLSRIDREIKMKKKKSCNPKTCFLEVNLQMIIRLKQNQKKPIKQLNTITVFFIRLSAGTGSLFLIPYIWGAMD